jgi:hypothetical protein
MSSVRGLVASSSSSSSSASRRFSTIESLEGRQLFAFARPDHIVIVIEQDRASDAIGNPIWSYLNQLASTGLVYTNSHGVTHPSEPNTLAIFSGSTQGIDDNGRNYSFSGPNLARSLLNAGLSFSGYVENLPADGSQVTQAGDGVYPDLYTRNINPMAQFTDIGIDPTTGQPRPNSKVNRTFGAFTAFPKTDYSSLPTVSFIIPNNLHNAHGSNEMEPWAGSPDEENNDILRKSADDWLRANLDVYLQWAKQNNSLLIVTQDEERWTGGNSQTVTTIVNGDADLFNLGTNSDYVNHYNLLRTITDMYGLSPLGVTGSYAALDTDASGQLSPDVTNPPPTQVGTSTSLSSSAGSSTFGQSVTFTATVSPPSGSLVPSGIVTFKDGATTIGTGTLNSAGVASLTLSSLSAGAHAITAVYGGSSGFTGSTSAALAHSVAKAPTSTSLMTSLASAPFGQSVTFTATTTGAGGSVTFKDGATTLATVAVDATGSAKFTTSSLTVGSHSISAVYSGGANHLGSTSPVVTQTITAVTTPANDSFANRIVLAGDVIVTTATNAAATKEASEPRHASNNGGKSLWWSWTAPASGTVIIDTFGSSFNTILGVYTGGSVASLSRVASNDNAGGTSQSRVSFSAVAGRTYQIAVDGYNGASGNITLRIHMSAKQPTNVAASDGAFTDRVAVTWSAAIGATSYEVWRNTKSSTKGAVKLGEVTATAFDDTTGTAGKTYWYFVRAKNAVSTSAYSSGNPGYRAMTTFASFSTQADSTLTKSSSSKFSSTRIVLDDVATR